MISFIVLAYNEEANIEAAIRTVFRAAHDASLNGFEIVAVNDGSTDGTGAILDKMAAQHPEIRVVVNEVNRGLGASIRRGFEVARCERIMIVAGDNDMSFELMRLLLRYRDVADVVLAFPINTEQRTVWRNVLSVLYRLIHVVAFRVFVNYVNAPGIFRTDLVRSLPLRSNRFSIVAEYNVKLLRSGCSYAEVPGFFQNPNHGKARRTVTLKNFNEVVRRFVQLFLEVHVTGRKRYNKTPHRVFIDFVGGTIAPMPGTQREVRSATEGALSAVETHDARA
jgi:glycosyltransferase involved in cell wall biosynthesis